MDSITCICLERRSVFRSGHKLLSNTLSNLDPGQRPLTRLARDYCKAALALSPARWFFLQTPSPNLSVTHPPQDNGTSPANPCKCHRDQMPPLSILVATCPSGEKSMHSYYCKLLRNLFSPPHSCCPIT